MQSLSPDVHKSQPFVSIRSLVRLLRKLKLRITTKGKLSYKRNVSFGPGAKLMIPEFIHIQNNFSCGKNFFVQTNLSIGDCCLFSSDVSIVGDDHHINESGYNNYWSGRKPASTVLFEGDNFVGYRATIVGNVRIGKGAIIGAGSLVIRDVEENTVVGGVPAKVIGQRNL